MASKHFIVVFFTLLFVQLSWSQEEEKKDAQIDSLQTDLKKDGLVVVDTLVAVKRAINPLAPAKAGFYSAVLPGLGQIYNKRYWKVPIVWAALGVGIATYVNFDNRYNAFRDAFKNRRVGLPFEENDIVFIPPTTTDQQLERLQNDRQNDRDLALLATIILYALNIVDANVDAHLKQFNVDDKLSLDMELQPYLELNPVTTDPNYGLALTIKF